VFLKLLSQYIILSSYYLIILLPLLSWPIIIHWDTLYYHVKMQNCITDTKCNTQNTLVIPSVKHWLSPTPPPPPLWSMLTAAKLFNAFPTPSTGRSWKCTWRISWVGEVWSSLSVVLRRTVCRDIDWRFGNLNGSQDCRVQTIYS